MIIVKSSMRCSLLGGGSDYSNYIEQWGNGLVIGFSIDKFSYVAAQPLPISRESRFVYNEIEECSNVTVNHKGIWNALWAMNFHDPVEITHFASLRGTLGLGTSSAFMVSLIKALQVLKNEDSNRISLIEKAVETENLYSNVGYQDAVFAVLGGLRLIEFTRRNSKILISTMSYIGEAYKLLEDYGLLFDLNLPRNSSEIVSTYIKDLSASPEVRGIHKLAEEGADLLDNFDLDKFSSLINQSYALKKKISPKISTSQINYLEDRAKGMGSLAFRLLGGGGGGSCFILAKPQKHEEIIDFFLREGCERIPYKISQEGCIQI